ncbi:MAG: sensor histidine kinase [Pontiellaceae bacterium]|nr:sensor histidine kinase [Pontiellaceae bacterium]
MGRIFLRKNLIWFISAILVIGFLGTSLISYFMARNSMREQIVSSSLPLTSDNIYSEIQRDLIRPVFISSLMAQDTFVRDWIIDGEQDVDQISRYLKEIRINYDAFTCFLVSEATHNYYYFDGILKEVDPDNEADAWYFRVRQMEPVYETNVDPDFANENAMTIFINYKVFDYDGNYIGATGVGLEVDALLNLMQYYGKKYARNLYLTDDDGNIVLSNNKDYTNIHEIDGIRAISKAALTKEGGAFEYRNEGSKVFINSRFVNELGWHLMVEEREDLAAAKISHALILNLIICGVITITVILLVAAAITLRERKKKEQDNLIAEQNQLLEISNRDLKQANQRKNQLLNILCHDLSNPFGVLISSLSYIEEDPEILKDLMSDITGALDNGMETIELVRNMRAMEEGKMDLPIDSIPLKPAVQDAVKLLHAQLEQKNIDLQIDIDEALTVSVNKIAFVNSVLSNLVTNAIKFSELGSTLEISAARTPDKQIKLTVLDHGIGMPEAIRDALFDLKRKTARSGTRGETGTGFGMPLVDMFIRAFNGRIEVFSRDIEEHPEDHGTRVELTLNP